TLDCLSVGSSITGKPVVLATHRQASAHLTRKAIHFQRPYNKLRDSLARPIAQLSQRKMPTRQFRSMQTLLGTRAVGWVRTISSLATNLTVFITSLASILTNLMFNSGLVPALSMSLKVKWASTIVQR